MVMNAGDLLKAIYHEHCSAREPHNFTSVRWGLQHAGCKPLRIAIQRKWLTGYRDRRLQSG